ncbi:hypothetical protein [Variovorax paradoxus]|jgi:hypothetical protein
MTVDYLNSPIGDDAPTGTIAAAIGIVTLIVAMVGFGFSIYFA